MSGSVPPGEQNSTDTAARTAHDSQQIKTKPRRVLACVLCQKRKVKCDRRFPCSNCIRASAQCVPATLVPAQRKRRFAERELLDRIHRYEAVLSENDINFEPLQKATGQESLLTDTSPDHGSPGYAQSSGSVSQQPNPQPYSSAAPIYQAKSLLQVLNQREHEYEHENGNDDFMDNEGQGNSPLTDVVDETAIKEAWDQLHGSNDHLLFGALNANIELATLHPAQAHIFKLWQIYLENVDPILKVTHMSSLQARIIDAAAAVTDLEPALEALMFSIYCVALASLTEDQCSTLFTVQKKELLKGYCLGCQQALLKCNFLRSADRDCLTALFLYLVSRMPETHRASLSSMLGIAMRIAQRMGIQFESANAKCDPFEGEMRRRLWWSLVIFDDRISEMSDQSTSMLTPAWDCKFPLNINDSDMRPDMKTMPTAHPQPSDSIFTAARSELNDVVRHSACHLDLVNPAMKIIAQQVRAEDLANMKLEELMDNKYLKFCNPEIPLQFLTLWSIRGHVAKTLLVECHSRWSDKSARPTELERDTALSYAVKMLECDTKLQASSLTTGYRWYLNLYFPFPAYIWIAQELRKRPLGPHAEYSWKVMDENYAAHFLHGNHSSNPLFQVFSAVVLKAWDDCDNASNQANILRTPPQMISDIKQMLGQIPGNTARYSVTATSNWEGVDAGNNLFPTTTNYSDNQFGTAHTTMPNMLELGPWSRPWSQPDFLGQNSVDVSPYPFNWSLMDWNFGYS